MNRRISLTGLAILTLAVLSTRLPAADEAKTHEGIVVSASADKLVMTDNEGKKEHSHMVSTATKITLDGKPAKLADLKKGHFVKVTTTKLNEKDVVTAIDARSTKS
jgi:hypothetical protein